MKANLFSAVLAVLAAGVGAAMPGAATSYAAAQADEAALSPQAQSLLTALERAAAGAGPDASLTELRARLLQTLIDAEQDAETERAALQRMRVDTESEAVRTAVIALLAQMPSTVEGYQALDDFALGGAEGGEAAVPGPPAASGGGGSDY